MPTPFKKKIHYFWIFRNHIINDLKSELPLYEITLQANKSEKPVELAMLENLAQDFSLPIEVVTGDANYDVEYILKYLLTRYRVGKSS